MKNWVGGFNIFVLFSTRNLGKIPILTDIFQKGIETAKLEKLYCLWRSKDVGV